jgi:serine/threonine protein kinase
MRFANSSWLHPSCTCNKRYGLALAAFTSCCMAQQQWRCDADESSKERESIRRRPSLLYYHPKTSYRWLIFHATRAHINVVSSEGLLIKSSQGQQVNEKLVRQSRKEKYDVDWKKPLGQGAFGAVYLGRDKITGEKVAIKEIIQHKDSYEREVDALYHVQIHGGHPHICDLREYFADGQKYYIVMDHVNGGEMFDHLIQTGPYSEADAARFVREVASALAFCHGISLVHGDLKPENIMMSSARSTDAGIKLVDFGGAQILQERGKVSGSNATSKTIAPTSRAKTPAYCPPEDLEDKMAPLAPSSDVWALGIIVYIMLTGLHPFDLTGEASDDDVEKSILSRKSPPIRNSPITAHLSSSAIDLLEKLIVWDPANRMTAMEMLEHPWVRGETARKDKIVDSDKRLGMFFKEFKSKLEAKVFADIVSWSDNKPEDVAKKTSLMERSFRALDSQHKGYLTCKDLQQKVSATSGEQKSNEDADTPGAPLSLSGFSDLLSENMKNRYFDAGQVVYTEGDVGNHMYFINSGTIEVTTSDGSTARRSQGDFFGEGALLHPKRIRSASIKCITPVHAIEISREYFDKYLASSETELTLSLREKDRTRKRNRAKTILRLQLNLQSREFREGEYLFKVGEAGDALYIMEEGEAHVLVDGHVAFVVKVGDVCGEHSLILGRPRNTSAVCVSENGCRVQAMKARDFYDLYHSSSGIRDSLRELCMRREIQKAIVRKTNESFPSTESLRSAFDAAANGRGELSLDGLRELLISFDPSLSEEEIMETLESMDVMKKGAVTFHEFSHIFGMDETKAASI